MSEARLEGLAERVLESDVVDWASELDSADPEERDVILALRDLARLAEVNGTIEKPGASAALTLERAPGSVPESLERWGHLEVLERVGTGASATVFRARDPHLNREGALKLFHFASPASPETKQRLMEEGRNLARVKHNNVVTIYGADEQEGRVALWMEYVQGQTLHDLATKQGTVSAEEAASMGIELCQALAAVHAQGLIHGDIKGQNVMREAGGRVVLMDFSTSRAAETAEGPEGRYLGTPLYMAPELFRGEPNSHQSDVYALGVLLFYMVTGTYPVKAQTIQGLREAHQRGEQVLLADVSRTLPDEFVAVVEKALARDPDKRFQSAQELETALAEFVEVAPPPMWKRVAIWMGTLVAIPAALTLLGFVTSMSASISLHVPPTFQSETVLDYLIWGVRATIPMAYYMWGAIMPTALVLAALIFFFVFSGKWQFGNVGNELARIRRRWLDGMDPMAIAAGFFLVSLGAVVGLSWAFQDVIDAMDRMYAARSMVGVDVAILAPEYADYHMLRKQLFSILILALAVAAGIVFPYLGPRMSIRAVRIMKAATLVMILATAVVMVYPYRLLWHSEFQQVEFEGRKAFVVSENPPDLLLYIPTRPEESRLVVQENDPRIEWGVDREMGDIFEP